MWSEKQDPITVNENVSSQSDKYWCSENSCDVHDFTHCITLRSGSGTQGMQAKFNGPCF